MLDEQYQTGNKKLDRKIEMALREDPTKPNRLLRILGEDDPWKKRTHKYGVVAVEERTYGDGTIFASKSEMERWDYLLKIQQAGEITELEKQVPFILQEGFVSKQYGEIKPIIYVADFVYTNLSFRKGMEGRRIIEDSKTGMRTDSYKNKRKMMLYKYAEYLFFEV